MRLASSHIIGIALGAIFESQRVGAHDVPYVGEVTTGVEVADAQYGFAQPTLDLGDLASEARRDEAVAGRARCG